MPKVNGAPCRLPPGICHRMIRHVVKLSQPNASEKQPPRKAASRGAHPSLKRRRAIRSALLGIGALVFFSSGYFTYQVAAATNKIFTKNTSGGSPLLQGKKVKEEVGRINVLLMGIGGEGHDGPNLTDTIQVISVDPRNRQVAMLSIPRDLYVDVPGAVGQKVKINEIHAIGEERGFEGGGPALLKQEVSKILGVPIHYFARIDFEGFKGIIDSMGGIDVMVEERLYDPYYPLGTGYQVVDIAPGLNQFDGATALKYARSRETSSDFARSKRQQQVLVATRDKALSLQFLTNPGKISGLLTTLGDRVRTDLSIGEMEKFASILKDIPSTSVQSQVIDSGPEGLLYNSTGAGGAFILLPRSGDYSGIQQFAADFFNGSAVATEKAGLELMNASGREGVAATLGTQLAASGYNVVSTGNADAVARETVIYDYTGTKPGTLSALQKRFGGRIITGQTTPVPGVDIRVVIGTDAASRSTAPGGAD